MEGNINVNNSKTRKTNIYFMSYKNKMLIKIEFK